MDNTAGNSNHEDLIATKIAEEVYSQRFQTNERATTLQHQPEDTADEDSEPQDDRKSTDTNPQEKLSFVQKV